MTMEIVTGCIIYDEIRFVLTIGGYYIDMRERGSDTFTRGTAVYKENDTRYLLALEHQQKGLPLILETRERV